MNLSPKARWFLGGVAVVLVALTAYDPLGLPPEVQGIIALMLAVLGYFGIVPPQVGGTQQGVVNPSMTEPPKADVESRASGGTTYRPPSAGFAFWPVAAVPYLLGANEVSEGEALFWIGVLVVVGCLIAAAVVAYRTRDWIVSLILLVVAIVAAVLLL